MPAIKELKLALTSEAQWIASHGCDEDQAEIDRSTIVQSMLNSGELPEFAIKVIYPAYVLLDVAEVEEKMADKKFAKSFKENAEIMFRNACESASIDCSFKGFKIDLEFPALIGSVSVLLPLTALQLLRIHDGVPLYEVESIYPLDKWLGDDNAICPGSGYSDEPSLRLVRI